MKKELDDKLVNNFPNLYKDRYADMKTTCMCWGFPGSGWYNLIYDLSSKLEKLILALPEEGWKDYRACQVKEKFGMLRFYMTHSTDEMDKLIDEAENKSATICEECGEPGKLRRGSWVRCLCDKHFKEFYK